MLNLEDTRIAFRSKSNKELRLAYRIFQLIRNPGMVKFLSYMIMLAIRIKLPVNPAVKSTIFKVFCGGEDIEQAGSLAGKLESYGVKSIITYSAEGKEVDEAFDQGIEIFSGTRDTETMPATYDVEGILLPRPFKITKIGPVNLFVSDFNRAFDFYSKDLGFTVTEEVNYQGHRVVFLRNGNEHHSLGLFPKALRAELGCSPRPGSATG